MGVERLEIARRAPYDHDGYERIDGVLHYAVDPAHELNAHIVDLDLCPRDDDGLVRFCGDLVLLRPTDEEQDARRLLVYVPNRGRTPIVPFSLPTKVPATEITDVVEPGDALLLRRGWSVAFVGWQWDVMRRPGLVGLDAPEARTADGRVPPGRVRVRFQPNDDRPDELLSHWPLHPRESARQTSHRPYPAAGGAEDAAELFESADSHATPELVPRERWRFARDEGGVAVPDREHVWLDGGFKKGRVYEVAYPPAIAPVAGAGLLAIRDAGSWLRRDESSPVRADHVFTYGVSQCGRFLRDFLHWGMNLDESERVVYDGVIPHVAGARRGEFNQRFAQPSVQHAVGLAHTPPFHDLAVSGLEEGLLSRQRSLGGVPRILTINTSSEYWRSDCSLVHTDLDAGHDIDPPADVRVYMLAGTQHSPGFPMLLNELPAYPGTKTANPMTTVSYSPLMRAAIVNLERWVSIEQQPPPSSVPRIAGGTAATREEVLRAFRRVSGAHVLSDDLLPSAPRLHLDDADARLGLWRLPLRADGTYPSLVSSVDEDGNEIAGVRLPDLVVPLGSHTGWNPWDTSAGVPGELVDMIGSTIPFRRTKADREGAGDPRPSIEERYESREAYLALVEKEAVRLVQERWLLDEDIEVVVRTCGRLYDALTR